MIMSKATSKSTSATTEINRTAPDRDKLKDKRNVLPKSPKVQQILRDYWAAENDRRKPQSAGWNEPAQ
jgi:hypothetical protein